MVLGRGLKLSTECAGFRASHEVQGRVSHHLCSARGHQHELQSNLQFAATCAGLGGAQERPRYELRLAATSASPGAT